MLNNAIYVGRWFGQMLDGKLVDCLNVFTVHILPSFRLMEVQIHQDASEMMLKLSYICFYVRHVRT